MEGADGRLEAVGLCSCIWSGRSISVQPQTCLMAIHYFATSFSHFQKKLPLLAWKKIVTNQIGILKYFHIKYIMGKITILTFTILGIARPSHDIMYSTLGMLIKERKIYHTGEGYFIVTPNTYFISNSAMKSSSKGALLKYNDPLDPSGTCTVNMEAELIRDCFLIASHCRSCHCFPEQTALNEQRHQQAGSQEPNGQRLKGSCESRFSVQNPATDMLADNHSRETAAHSSYSVKEKEKGKKFGLSLFWRNTSKKEKPTKIYSSFAAQFPPEEWPVRDEDNLDNIPRDVEYEIIRRINPILTTDNLIKHAALMQKIEKQKQYISQGTSTEALTKHKHLSKVYARKKQSKTAKRHRKAQSNKEKQISKTQREIKVDELIPDFDELETYVEHLLPSEVIVCSKQPCEDGKDVDSHLIYKKKISNPFQDIPRRGNKYTKECKNQKTSELKSRAPKSKKNFPRPHSLDLSRTLDYNAEQFFIIKCGDEKEQLATDDSSHVQNDGSDYADYSHYQALQSGSKYEYLRESSACKHTMRTTQASVGERYSCNAVMDEKSVEMKYSQKSNQAHPCDKADIYGLLDDNSHQLKNICLSNYKGVTHQFNQSENTASFRHNGHLKSERNSNSTSKWLDLVNPQCKELMYNEQAFYQKVRSGNSCSSLYHAGEHHSDTESFDLHAKQFLCHSSDIGKGNDTGQEPGSQVWGNRSHFLENKTDKNKLDCCDPEGNECLSLTRSKDSLKEYPKVSLERESCSCHQVARYAYDERAGSKAHGQMLGTVDSSAFDFYDVHETDGKSWQKSVNEVGGKLASFALRQKGKEIKTNLAGDTQSSENLVAAVQDHNMQHERNHLEGTGNHSITGDSGIDSPR